MPDTRVVVSVEANDDVCEECVLRLLQQAFAELGEWAWEFETWTADSGRACGSFLSEGVFAADIAAQLALIEAAGDVRAWEIEY